MVVGNPKRKSINISFVTPLAPVVQEEAPEHHQRGVL
jgi:hypothetical protein